MPLDSAFKEIKNTCRKINRKKHKIAKWLHHPLSGPHSFWPSWWSVLHIVSIQGRHHTPTHLPQGPRGEPRGGLVRRWTHYNEFECHCWYNPRPYSCSMRPWPRADHQRWSHRGIQCGIWRLWRLWSNSGWTNELEICITSANRAVHPPTTSKNLRLAQGEPPGDVVVGIMAS